jgi:ubiquinone/menaquinone biosynthesis C-methylase UbiE
MAAETDLGPRAERYVFDNLADETQRRFAGLSAKSDCGTFRLLIELGVTAGWRCLEVGCGSGSVAAWLAERVGTSSHVLATDIDPRLTEALRRPNIDTAQEQLWRCQSVELTIWEMT